MRTLGNVFAITVGSLLLACALPDGRSLAAPDCPADSQIMSKVELYFGLDIPGEGGLNLKHGKPSLKKK